MRFSSLNRLISWRALYDRRPAVICALTLFMILSGTGSEPLAREIPVQQHGSIKGQVVVDITDQRRPLAGVVIFLSSERPFSSSFLPPAFDCGDLNILNQSLIRNVTLRVTRCSVTLPISTTTF